MEGSVCGPPVGGSEQLEVAGALPCTRNAELCFAFAESEADLATVWEMAETVWVIYPKGRKELTEAQVRNYGRAMAMMDTKVASFSSMLTALRFSRVIRPV